MLKPIRLKASDLLLMPRPNNEFFANHVSPLKLFEYLSSRRPNVASRLPAIMEVLQDGENGVLAEPGNPSPRHGTGDAGRAVGRDPGRAGAFRWDGTHLGKSGSRDFGRF